MKLNTLYTLLIMFCLCGISDNHAMNDDKNENFKKRYFEDINNECFYNTTLKKIKFCMSEDDWKHALQLLITGDQTRCIAQYFNKIVMGGELERLAIIALIDEHSLVLQEIKKYANPLLASILHGDVTHVQKILEENNTIIKPEHLHIAMELNYHDIFNALLAKIDRNSINGYRYQDKSIVQHAILNIIEDYKEPRIIFERLLQSVYDVTFADVLFSFDFQNNNYDHTSFLLKAFNSDKNSQEINVLLNVCVYEQNPVWVEIILKKGCTSNIASYYTELCFWYRYCRI